MSMDTVTGHCSDRRPAGEPRRRVAVLGREAGPGEAGLREADPREVADDERAGVVSPHRSAVRSGLRRGPAVCTSSHHRDLHGSRLTPRGRVVVALVWLLMAATAALMLATVPGDGGRAPATTTKVMVEPGQTLWQLAGVVQPAADRHETVDAIMSLNGLESASQIRPGDILVVPVEP